MAKVYCGRRVLTSAYDAITDKNVVGVLSDIKNAHQANSAEIDYLYRYYKGEQPILYREKEVRPEICNTLVENHAYEIVSFKTGYVFGEPIQYVRKSENVSEDINGLTEKMMLANKPSVDKEMGEWAYIAGTSYRMVQAPDDDNPDALIDCLDPRHTFVVYSTGFGRPPLMGGQFIKVKTEEGKDKEICSIYTSTHYIEVEGDAVTQYAKHPLGGIPIIEYPANSARLGAFEVVLPILDALNIVASNRLDGVEQFVQAFIKFIDCDISAEDFAKLRDEGAIKVKSTEMHKADVDMITSELNQGQVQMLVDNLYQKMLVICGMPNRQGETRSTSDSGQAVLLRDGWSAAEARARDTELTFKRSERRFLDILLGILKTNDGIVLNSRDIDIKFTRNRSDNLLVKSQGLQNILEAGVHPRNAFELCGLFSDHEKVFQDSAEYLEKWKEKEVQETPGNNKPFPPDEGGVI